MATTTKTQRTVRRPVRRPARPHLSDRRYYVQCAYHTVMAVMVLVAFVIANH